MKEGEREGEREKEKERERERERFPVFRSPTRCRPNLQRYYATPTTSTNTYILFSIIIVQKNSEPHPWKVEPQTYLTYSHFTHTHTHTLKHTYTHTNVITYTHISFISYIHMCIRGKYKMYTILFVEEKRAAF